MGDTTMTTIRMIAVSLLVPGLAACALWQEDEVALSEVPVAAIEAAQAAVPGIQLKDAEARVRDGRTIYEIDGKVDGVKHEIRVTADGEVLKVENEG